MTQVIKATKAEIGRATAIRLASEGADIAFSHASRIRDAHARGRRRAHHAAVSR
jgi:hypothetical protein